VKIHLLNSRREKMKVELTANEMKTAAMVGTMRHADAIAQGRTSLIPTANNWQRHIEGSLAEFAFAKAFGLFWSGLGGIGSIDIGSDIEIRTSRRPDACLIVRHRDDDNSKFVLVLGDATKEFTIVGWLFGREAKRSDRLKNPNSDRAAFFVPQSVLWPMSEIMR